MASPLPLSQELVSQLAVPQPHRKVYKDECVFSFRNPYHSDGIYVNLKTLIGVTKKFLPLDQKRSRKFPLYLHQKWTRRLKPKVESSTDASQPTKLAVGVEGGFQLPDQRIETVKQTRLVLVSPDGSETHSLAYPCEEKLPEIVIKIVEAVLSRTDATEAKDIFSGSLEEELKESKHAKSLVQLDNGVRIPNDPKKWACQESGLTKNLWLNLHTGYIGSGRKETGGTEAAIRHYEETGRKYPLVVKLGTITPDKADVYSYDEDCGVLDPKLDEHLAHWGLDRSKLFKTDKDMTEINIDAQSKAFEASVITGEGEKQEPASGLGFKGLVNFGNSCYINSTLQMLFTIKPFQDRYSNYASEVFYRSPSDPGADLTTQLCKLAEGLQDPDLQKETEENRKLKQQTELPDLSDPAIEIKPKMLKKAIAKDHFEFAGGRQQDAQEYILHVFKAISQDARAFPQTPGCQDLSKIFEFATEEKTVDGQSKQVEYKVQQGQTFLTLPIPKPEPPQNTVHKGDGQPLEKKCKKEEKLDHVPLEKCLEAFKHASVLGGYTSPVTGEKGVAYRSNLLRTFPEYMLIQLYRFEQVDLRAEKKGFQIQKIRRQVVFPESLDIKTLASTGPLQGETLLPKKKKQKPTVNADIVDAVKNMGFTENAGIRAALATSNAGPEQAVNWVLSHMADADINDPIQDGDDDDDDDSFPPEIISQVAAMGFSDNHAKRALKATKGDVPRAIDWLLSRGGELGPEEKKKAVLKPGKNNDSSSYKLLGFISHIGDRATAGHYVCHLKKNGKWALFNDNKVTYCENPPFGLGYIYLYQRI